MDVNNVLSEVYIWTVVLVLFNLTIFVHEMGHFLVAKWRKVKADRFAIWFGPAIWKRTWRGVEYRWGCIPLGGYVAIPQLMTEGVEGKSETPAEQLPPLRMRDKIPILLAGSVCNVILGFLIACILWKVGIPAEEGYNNLVVWSVEKDSAEHAAGIRQWDRLVTIDDKPVHTWDEVRANVALSVERKVRVGIERDGARQTFEITPERNKLYGIRMLRLEHASTPVVGGTREGSPAEKAGIRQGDKILEVDGVRLAGPEHMAGIVSQHEGTPIHLTLLRGDQRMVVDVTPTTDGGKHPPQIGIGFQQSFTALAYPTPWEQVQSSLGMIVKTFNALYHRATTGVGPKDFMGVIGMADTLHTTIKMDIRFALHILVIININLAVVNLLPIPVLDGGHIVITVIEKIRRRALNPKLIETTHIVFVTLLISFMLYVGFNDVKRILRRGAMSQDPPASTTPAAPGDKTPQR